MDRFPKFAELPPELRTLIWNCFDDLTLPQVYQTVRIEDQYFQCLPEDHEPNDRPQFFFERMVATPEILQICQDSRSVGLKSYSLAFHFPDPFSEGPDGREWKIPRGIYYKPSKDLIIVGGDFYHFRQSEVVALTFSLFDMYRIPEKIFHDGLVKPCRALVDISSLLAFDTDLFKTLATAEVVFVQIPEEYGEELSILGLRTIKHAIERLTLWSILDKKNYGDPVDNKMVVRVIHDGQEALDTLISARTISSYQDLSSRDLWERSEKKDFEILFALEEDDIDSIIDAVGDYD